MILHLVDNYHIKNDEILIVSWGLCCQIPKWASMISIFALTRNPTWGHSLARLLVFACMRLFWLSSPRVVLQMGCFAVPDLSAIWALSSSIFTLSVECFFPERCSRCCWQQSVVNVADDGEGWLLSSFFDHVAIFAFISPDALSWAVLFMDDINETILDDILNLLAFASALNFVAWCQHSGNARCAIKFLLDKTGDEESAMEGKCKIHKSMSLKVIYRVHNTICCNPIQSRHHVTKSNIE